MDMKKWLLLRLRRESRKRTSPLWLLLFICSTIVLKTEQAAQPEPYAICGQIGNYTDNSTYSNNLNTILSSLPTKLDRFGFYNGSVGKSPDRVSVLALCRGDVEINVCRGCVREAATSIPRFWCPNQKEAFGWFVKCTVAYSNEPIIGPPATSPAGRLRICQHNFNNVTSPDKFNDDLSNLLNNLTSQAKDGGEFLKFAATTARGPDFQTIYGLVQCVPVFLSQECSDCLSFAFGEMSQCGAQGKIGGLVVKPSCHFRYEIYNFFNNTLIATPPSKPAIEAPQQKSGKKDNTIRTVIIIVVPIVLAIILTACLCICLRKRRKQKNPNNDNIDAGEDISTVESLQYDFSTIKTATNNFMDSNKLGQGGFGSVYKGVLLNGQEVAVKRLSRNSGQGDIEFKNEVVLVANLQHRNLVRLLGFSLEGKERLLVYEYVPNASLDQFLFDPVRRADLDWETRYKIICGVSKGLLYLHEDSRLRIIHRDLKASNILLDSQMNPKISDFGMARLFELDETQGTTSRIVGTYGYMAPEYAMHGQFSVKSDVFSFGVLVLEILSGKKNICFRTEDSVQDLLSYAWRRWREGTALDIIDPMMLRGESGLVPEMMKCIHIALLCVQENASDRPTMSAVVLMLSGSSQGFSKPSAPAFFIHSTVSSSEVSQPPETVYSSSQNEVSISELDPR